MKQHKVIICKTTFSHNVANQKTNTNTRLQLVSVTVGVLALLVTVLLNLSTITAGLSPLIFPPKADFVVSERADPLHN